MPKSYSEQLQDVVRAYTAAGGAWPATAHMIAAWAIEYRMWAPQPSTLVSQCAEQLAKAMREEYITDAQGRTIRAKHAARVGHGSEQMVLWADIRTAPRNHMEIAFQQRRQQIVGDCRQLKADVDSFNDNRSPLKPIQMVFDFNDDLAELESIGARSAM